MKSREIALDMFVKHLAFLSPERVLERGYAIVLDKQGHVVGDASLLKPGHLLDLRLAKGTVEVAVKATR